MFFYFFAESLRPKDLNKFFSSSRQAFDLRSKILLQPRCNLLRLNFFVISTFFSYELCAHHQSFSIFQKSLYVTLRACGTGPI